MSPPLSWCVGERTMPCEASPLSQAVPANLEPRTVSFSLTVQTETNSAFIRRLKHIKYFVSSKTYSNLTGLRKLYNYIWTQVHFEPSSQPIRQLSSRAHRGVG
eukprot:6205949-Amphidinium_carterae.1